MKEFITKSRSLHEETEKLLNAQIKLEAVSSAIYLSMASWAEIKGYEKSSAFSVRSFRGRKNAHDENFQVRK
jgi:ferritin